MPSRTYLILCMLLASLLSGCGAYCAGYTQNGTKNMDGACAGFARAYLNSPANPANQQQSIYSTSSASNSDALLLQMQQQQIQNNINLINSPKYTEIPAPYVNRNTQPFQNTPQQAPIQPPVVNCVPNGMGGFRCQ